MFAQLALPEQVHRFGGKSLLFGKEFENTTTSLHDFYVRILTKNYL
jgi:hypothetical protein